MSRSPPSRLPRGAKQRAAAIDARLALAIPRPVVELDFTSAWQLLVATLLAAQSTDKVINTITPELFRRWPEPRDLAGADIADVEQVVKASGFFRQKARTIVTAATRLRDDFGGHVPTEIEALLTIPGVGRKTANVVLGAAFRIASGMVVDTHVTRLSSRLGLSNETEPERIEVDLMKAFPRTSWIDASHRLILHGRYVCKARAPDCGNCTLADICPSAFASG